MKKPLYFFKIIFAFCLTFSSFCFAQNTDNILDNYADYADAPREIAYVHLNKSTYIEGELLGFTAYIFDMYSKEPSTTAQNLYCTINDAKGNVIKKQLLKIENGVAANVFEIDSTLSNGIFTFKAYTNWMRNFREKHHFEQTFKVIDADEENSIKPLRSEDLKIDFQLLGEGGHLLFDVPNTLGIIAKDQFGKGVAKATGRILDNNNVVISEFKLNEVGIAKTIFTPEPDKTYTAELNLNDRVLTTDISNIQVLGLAITLTERSDKVTLQIQTNKQTKDQFNDKNLKISLHDGSEMQIAEFRLDENGKALLSYPIESLFPGINIFTVFNEENKPLLERLYFNSKNLKSKKITNVKSEINKDSLNLNISILNIDSSKFSNLSVSVLPTGTKSYNHHNSLLSQLYIQPFIKGTMENSRLYFNTINNESKYNLDLLMMTQGWSSYEWNSIFNYNDEFLYPYERGIDIVANINDNKNGTYVVYPLAEKSTQLFEIPETEKQFTIKNTFPNKDDLFRIGYLDIEKQNFTKKPSIYLQFFPSKFADLNSNSNVIQETYIKNDLIVKNTKRLVLWDNSQQLDEVVVEAKTEYTRAEELANKAINSRVDIISDNQKMSNLRIDIYLQRLGFVTYFDYFTGKLIILNPRVLRGNPVPLVYLNDMFLSSSGINSDFSILTFIDLSMIDYIEYELYGFGGGIRGQAGFIKIKTDPTFKGKKATNNIMTYDVPLRFQKDKKFYTPKYQYYNTQFFKEYGTIDWQPKLKIDSTGKISFNVFDTGTENISLYVEGIVNDSEYISEEIIVKRNN